MEFSDKELRELIGHRALIGPHTFEIVKAWNTRSFGVMIAGPGFRGVRLVDVKLLPPAADKDSPAKTLEQLLTF